MKKNMDVLRYLQRVPFFGDFSKKELSEVANLKSNFMTFKKGNLIIKQGDIDLSFFVLIKGRGRRLWCWNQGNFLARCPISFNPTGQPT